MQCNRGDYDSLLRIIEMQKEIPPIKPDPRLDVFISGEKKVQEERKEKVIDILNRKTIEFNALKREVLTKRSATCSNHQWVTYIYEGLPNEYRMDGDKYFSYNNIYRFRVTSLICANCMEIKEIKIAQEEKK